jgi:hypothetical protein
MRPVLFGLILLLVILLFVVTAGLGVGFAVHRVVPRIDLGSAAILGVIAVAFSLHVMGGRAQQFPSDLEEEEEEEPVAKRFSR